MKQSIGRLRRALVAGLLLSTLALPASSARASGAGEERPDHRIGVVMAVVCGLTARVALGVPVPYAGIAVVSCVAAFLDALNTPDKP